MRGPIDYIIVGFPGNNFKGEILKELAVAVDNKSIAVLDLAVITKDAKGNVTKVEATSLDTDTLAKLGLSGDAGLISDEDVEEVGSILDNNCSAGLLIVEMLWAKGLKQAIINANGVLLAEGRIHPDADQELNAGKGA
jgi:uncharacterized membrane protein